MRRWIGVTAMLVTTLVVPFVPFAPRADAGTVASSAVPTLQAGPTLPAGPLRTVPGIASATGFRVRTAPGGGTYQYVAPIPLPSGATPFFGDWDGDGAATPGYFRDGTWTLYGSYVGAPKPIATFTFGAPGDRPVIGDWDGNGSTGIGFVRNGYWVQRQSASPGPASALFAFGRASDWPVAGDWNGDRRDSPGIQRGTAFRLTDVNGISSQRYSFSFGRVGDRPVAGDWNGDGRDTVGIVRAREAWYLLSALRDGAPRESRVVTISAGTPAPFPSPAGSTGGGCPTASVTRRPALPTVVPPASARLGLSMAAESPPLRTALTNALRTLLGPEFTRTLAGRTHHPYLNLGADSGNAEVAFRPWGMTMMTLAVGLRMDGFDEAAVGHAKADAVRQMDWVLRSLACQHLSISPGGWGHNWQSGMWAATAAYGAWLVWDQLSPQTRAMVAVMMHDEAEYVAGRPVEYWANRQGVLTPGRAGDSAAEEMAWDAGALGFAMQMMPGDAHLDRWRRKGTQMAAASYASRADTSSADLVNGIAFRNRLAGYNTTPEGAVVNHDRLSADYTTCARQAWWAMLYGALGRQPVPEAFVRNHRRVWGALTKVSWPETGVIYRPDGTISYPAPAEWGRRRFPTFAATDAMADLVDADRDPATGLKDPTPALTWMDRHIDRTVALQARHADGHLYEPGEELYPAPEQLGAHLIAYTWAARYASRNLPPARLSTALVPLP